MSETAKSNSVPTPTPKADNLEIPLDELSSPTLDRLIEEVRNEQIDSPHAYNRVHHRHNR